MAAHVGPPPSPDRPPVPEPSYAERARTLAAVARTGALATLSRRHPGHPFASVMPYALDAAGHPLFLVSTMVMHTQNLAVDSRASLLVVEPEVGGEPLAQARLTLMGEARPVAAGEIGAGRRAYLARHPNAASWIDFSDFAFWRLQVRDVYFVGGFAAMDWVTAEAYLAAGPDPLVDDARGILEHMNTDHADALVTYARVLAGEPADEAAMVAVDRLGFKLRIRHGDRRGSVRIAFPHEVRSAAEVRTVLIDMLRAARRR